MGDWFMGENKKEMIPKLMGETWRKYPTETSKQKVTYGLFECQYCKKEFESSVQSVKRGDTKSCGCNSRETQTTHGMSQNKFYKTWYGMTYRCNNPKDKNYGGRGITVCEEWLDLKVFIDWCEETYIEGMTLDRIDVNGNYQPENCRWVDMSVQNSNKGIKETNTSGYTGVTWHKNRNRWCSSIRSQGVIINIGTFKDKMDAVVARDNYIIENKLPHPLSSNYKIGETNE